MPEAKTQNVQRSRNGASSRQDFDLEERLLNYSAEVIRLTERMPHSRAGNYVAGQLLRSGTSPLPNHSEAQAAESRDDFIHKMSICLKELRESRRWLRLIHRVPLTRDLLPVETLIQETEELIRIFAKASKLRSPAALTVESWKLNVGRFL